jgi:hypothetical protein
MAVSIFQSYIDKVTQSLHGLQLTLSYTRVMDKPALQAGCNIFLLIIGSLA